MNKAIFATVGYFLIGLFLFSLFAPLNQSSAAGSGQRCQYGTRVSTINCDDGLSCILTDETSGACQADQACYGVCRKPCTVRFSENGSSPNSCNNGDGEVCYLPNTCQSTSCSGYCIPDSMPHVGPYGTCSKANTTSPQGNCLSGVCNVIPGKTTGTCFPSVYQCNRSDLPNYWSCPGDYTCGGKDTKCKTGTVYQRQTASCGVCDPAELSTITCKCGHDPKPGQTNFSQVNDFTCKNGFGETFGPSFCSDATQACYDDKPTATMRKSDVANGQTLYGIQCLTPEQKNGAEPTKPPPAPPCADPNEIKNKGTCSAINSALGVLSTEPGKFISQIFGIVLATSGAIAVILIMRAGYQIMTARGNPEGLQKGREQIVAAIVGLMFLLFSFVLLQVIGGDLLGIPNFGTSGTNSAGTVSCTVGVGGGQGTCSAGQTCVSSTGSACSGGVCAGTCR